MLATRFDFAARLERNCWIGYGGSRAVEDAKPFGERVNLLGESTK